MQCPLMAGAQPTQQTSPPTVDVPENPFTDAVISHVTMLLRERNPSMQSLFTEPLPENLWRSGTNGIARYIVTHLSASSIKTALSISRATTKEQPPCSQTTSLEGIVSMIPTSQVPEFIRLAISKSQNSSVPSQSKPPK